MSSAFFGLALAAVASGKSELDVRVPGVLARYARHRVYWHRACLTNSLKISVTKEGCAKRHTPARPSCSVLHFAVNDSVPSRGAFGASLLPSPVKASTICSWFFCSWFFCSLSLIESCRLLALLFPSGLPHSRECRVGGGASGFPDAGTVRRSNCTGGFPACSFHEDSCFRGAIDGIN